MASVKKGKPELRKKGIASFVCRLSSSHARYCGQTEKELEKKERSLPVLRG